jgi:hypothetical protein
MLIPVFEAYGTIDSYPLSSTLAALITKNLTDSSALDLNLPYGNQNTGFEAGMIAQLASESSATVVELSDGVSPIGIFADSLTDAARSQKGSFYYLCQNVKVKVKTNYDTSQSYPVNTLLTTIPSGTNQGKLTPTSNYASQPVVGIVMEAPSNAANDDFMIIMTDLQY